MDGECIWLYCVGGVVWLVGIKDVGIEDWFYLCKGVFGELMLDDVIIVFE